MKMGTPVTFLGKAVTLKEVAPVKRSTETVQGSDYRFTFSVGGKYTTNGTLTGSVSVGPVCPVGTPGYPCTPTPEMYAAAKVFVYKMDKKTLVQTITPDKDGNFSIQLAPGSYFIDMIKQTMGGTTGVPTTITILPGGTVTLFLTVDTGLR